MGSRGKLKLAGHLKAVPDVTKGTAAADVPALAPGKPAAVAEDTELSALWDEVVPELDRAGLVTTSDGPAVEMLLRHFLLARRAADSVAEIAVHDHHNNCEKKNPAEAVFRAESGMFLEYAKQLGMTFVSRARTPGKPAGGGEPNPFMPEGAME